MRLGGSDLHRQCGGHCLHTWLTIYPNLILTTVGQKTKLNVTCHSSDKLIYIVGLCGNTVNLDSDSILRDVLAINKSICLRSKSNNYIS